MFETAERRTLFGRRTRIERIDFHDIAVPIRLVGIFRDIDAFVGCRPPEPSVRMLYAISLEDGVELFDGVAGGKVTVEVFPQVRYLPQGVRPLPQLLKVPRPRVPAGSAAVFSKA